MAACRYRLPVRVAVLTFEEADGSIITDIKRVNVGDDAHKTVEVSSHLIRTL